MRTAKTFSISVPAAEFKKLEKLAAEQSRTVDQLVFDALLEYREHRDLKEPASLAEAIRFLQEDARAKGSHKRNKRLMNEEIAAARAEIQARGKKRHPAA